jgi:chromosome segregation ATPase
MEIEQQIEQIKTALAAVDTAIAQTQSALQNPSTTSADLRALRSNLIDLQAQHSQLSTELINLQAAQTVVPADTASMDNVKTMLPLKMTIAKAKELKSIQTSLDSSIADRSMVQAVLTHGTNVSALVKRLKGMPMGARRR